MDCDVPRKFKRPREVPTGRKHTRRRDREREREREGRKENKCPQVGDAKAVHPRTRAAQQAASF
jgi:hypothetical protein